MVIILSVFVGIAGTAWNIYSSYDALPSAETHGIGAIGDSIRNALFFSAGGLVAVFIGVILLVLGQAKK